MRDARAQRQLQVARAAPARRAPDVHGVLGEHVGVEVEHRGGERMLEAQPGAAGEVPDVAQRQLEVARRLRVDARRHDRGLAADERRVLGDHGGALGQLPRGAVAERAVDAEHAARVALQRRQRLGPAGDDDVGVMFDALGAPCGDRGIVLVGCLAAAQRVADRARAGDPVRQGAPARVDPERIEDRHDAAQLVDGGGRERRRGHEQHAQRLQRRGEVAQLLRPPSGRRRRGAARPPRSAPCRPRARCCHSRCNGVRRTHVLLACGARTCRVLPACRAPVLSAAARSPLEPDRHARFRACVPKDVIETVKSRTTIATAALAGALASPAAAQTHAHALLHPTIAGQTVGAQLHHAGHRVLVRRDLRLAEAVRKLGGEAPSDRALRPHGQPRAAPAARPPDPRQAPSSSARPRRPRPCPARCRRSPPASPAATRAPSAAAAPSAASTSSPTRPGPPMGGSGDPAAAPEAEQDRLAAKLYATRRRRPVARLRPLPD